MTNFTTFIHVTGSARKIGDDLPYLRTIVQAVYDNHAMVFRDWISAAVSRRKKGIADDDVDWAHVLEKNTEAVQLSDMVIIESTQNRFSQGYQAYLASQYKKPTLVVTRSQVDNRFISGVESKYITVKQYKTEDELKSIVEKFIKQNIIAEKDLRFNMFLDRHIYKFLRDMSYETGVNKSEIVRQTLLKAIKQRNNL